MQSEITTDTARDRRVAADVADLSRTTGTWLVVPDTSTAGFAVRDKLVTTVHGSLPVEDGRVVLTAGGEVAEAWVTLAVPGIATGNAHRDRDLQKPRFLDAATSPSIRVETLTATTTRPRCTARAVLLARGQRAPIDLDVEVLPAPTGAPDGEVLIRVTGRLDRTPLGIGVPTLVIGRFLDLEAELTLRRSPRPAGPAAEAGSR